MRTSIRSGKGIYSILATFACLFYGTATADSSGEYTIFRGAEEAFEIPPGTLHAMCFVESGHKRIDIQDTNGKKSYGVCQVQLETARFVFSKVSLQARCSAGSSYLGVFQLPAPRGRDLSRNSWINAMYAAAYLRYQYDRYGSWEKALGAYNQGHWKPHRQNRKYVNKVLALM